MKVSALCSSIALALPPSLIFFFGLPLFLRSGLRFGFAVPASVAVMLMGYAAYYWGLGKFGFRI